MAWWPVIVTKVGLTGGTSGTVANPTMDGLDKTVERIDPAHTVRCKILLEFTFYSHILFLYSIGSKHGLYITDHVYIILLIYYYIILLTMSHVFHWL